MSPKRSARPELVIFDCDGVLVDSEPISISNPIRSSASSSSPSASWPRTTTICPFISPAT